MYCSCVLPQQPISAAFCRVPKREMGAVPCRPATSGQVAEGNARYVHAGVGSEGRSRLVIDMGV